MKQRVRVLDTTAIVVLVSGSKGDADTGLFLRGSLQCLDLAELLIEAASKIMDNEDRAQVPSGPGFFTSRRS